MDLVMKRCMDFTHTEMRQIPDIVAEVSHPNFIVYSMFAALNHARITKFIFLLQRLLEKLNKSGVMYKPAAVVPSADNDVDEELDSFENGPYEKKEFVYKDDSDGLEPVIDLTQPGEPVVNQNNDKSILSFSLSFK